MCRDERQYSSINSRYKRFKGLQRERCGASRYFWAHQHGLPTWRRQRNAWPRTVGGVGGDRFTKAAKSPD